ncbi:MAG: SUF system NifU family Fe-S cluster assembly protein [bacterium]
MSDLEDLYQQVIIDHSQHPHNFCTLEHPSCSKEGYNPLCGDKLTLYVNEKNGIITNIGFQGSGCAISTASASLMSDAVLGKTITEALELFDEFQKLVTTGKTTKAEKLGKLTVLAGVSEFPMRVKCATLAWHTLKSALEQL